MSSRRNVLAGALLHAFIVYVPIFMAVVFSIVNSGGANESSLLPLIFPLHMATMLATLAGWIWMLVHAVKNPSLVDNDRVIWVLAMVLGGQLGALVYFWMHFRNSGWERLAREQEAHAF